MTTIMFQRGNRCLVGEIILTVLEPLDSKKRQVVFFCKDKAGNRYRVPKSDVLLKSEIKPMKPAKKGKKKKRKCCA